MRITQNKQQNFKGLTTFAKPLSVFYNKNSVIPTLIIETGVTLGRTYEANKKGGKKEAIERFVEQGISAIVWLWGVQAIRNIGSLTAKLFNKENSKNFKDINIISSTAIATIFIGFILPKINHFISKSIIDKDKKKEINKKTNKQTNLQIMNIDDYKNKIKKNNVSFKSISNFANLLENNSTARLFITDTGVILGRYKNGRNKYEKIEGLFRDIASIYFYLRATNDFVKGTSKLFNIETIKNEQLQNLIKNPSLVSSKDNKMIKSTLALYSIGTVLSSFALGILIPKVQYLIRNKLTNKDTFPGDEGYQVDK